MQKDQLEVRDTPKGQFYFATLSKKGRPTSEVLKEVGGLCLLSLGIGHVLDVFVPDLGCCGGVDI